MYEEAEVPEVQQAVRATDSSEGCTEEAEVPEVQQAVPEPSGTDSSEDVPEEAEVRKQQAVPSQRRFRKCIKLYEPKWVPKQKFNKLNQNQSQSQSQNCSPYLQTANEELSDGEIPMTKNGSHIHRPAFQCILESIKTSGDYK
jgi:hypothetical protein